MSSRLDSICWEEGEKNTFVMFEKMMDDVICVPRVLNTIRTDSASSNFGDYNLIS